jgi:2,3-bisphosphoglycerate-dependent phosphoglycerate mutase
MFKSPILPIITLLLFTSALNAQKQRFIILRHAEKDTTVAGSQMMQADPPLNSIGQERAQSIVRKFKQYKISTIYSTNYNRTKSTVLPLANTIGLSINNYDPKQLKSFADELKAEVNHSKTILIVGHSNTSPRLVNMLLGKDEYKDLDESVYNQYWIVKLNGQKKHAKVILY